MVANVASLIKFSELCDVFVKTRGAKKQDKTSALASFIRLYREKADELQLGDAGAYVSFYPALRLILPQLERERGTYGLKEYTLAKRFTKILCLPPQSTDASRLLHFRSSAGNDKDFADAAYWVLRKHFLGNPKLSILDVNQYLDVLAEKNANNDPRGLDAELYKLLQDTSAEEQKWLIRIILKDLRIGVGQDRVLRLYHPDAVDLFSTNNSLSMVCEMLHDASQRLHQIEVKMFHPFRPMLSQRCDAVQFHRIFASGIKLYIETKFDGERFQLHMDNDEFKYFSRNGYDYTSTYGSSYSSGFYTPNLRGAFDGSVSRIILDGEMMTWNKKTQQFATKGMEFDVKHLNVHSTHQPCFCVFDILLLNDEVLTNKPLKDRLQLLHFVIRPAQGVIDLSHRVEATTDREVLGALNSSVDREEEGIVFKDVTSVYKSNDRNAGWWKMKLEYFENVMNDLDVIVMGGYYGDGRHHNQIHGFLVGVAVPSTENGELPTQYHSLGRVASGLNKEESRVIEEKLGPHWRKIKEGDPLIQGLQWGKDKPDVWIPPHQSCVLQIRASELIRVHSLEFKTDYTLRFPRIQKIRLDKPYYECMTVEELRDLTSSAQGVRKLTKRHLQLDDLKVPEKERKVRKRQVEVELAPVDQESQLLAGYEFCVLTGTAEWKKSAVEMDIRRHGGTVVINEGPNTLCILVGDDHPRVSMCKRFDAPYDLVRLPWLRDVLDSSRFRTYAPRDLLHAKKGTRLRLSSSYDKYGDSYTENSTLESVQEVVEFVKQSNDYAHLMPLEVAQLEGELGMSQPLNVFRDYVAYFDRGSGSSILKMEELEFKFLGGAVSEVLDEAVTHVVMDNSEDDMRKGSILNNLAETNNSQAEIVSRHFISNKYREVCDNMSL